MGLLAGYISKPDPYERHLESIEDRLPVSEPYLPGRLRHPDEKDLGESRMATRFAAECFLGLRRCAHCGLAKPIDQFEDISGIKGPVWGEPFAPGTRRSVCNDEECQEAERERGERAYQQIKHPWREER